MLLVLLAGLPGSVLDQDAVSRDSGRLAGGAAKLDERFAGRGRPAVEESLAFRRSDTCKNL